MRFVFPFALVLKQLDRSGREVAKPLLQLKILHFPARDA
jgi:hypothetical protein